MNRLIVELEFHASACLPYEYQQLIGGFVYNMLRNSDYDDLHNKRGIKGFTYGLFSKTKHKNRKGFLLLDPKPVLYISSISSDLIQYLYDSLKIGSHHRLGLEYFFIRKKEILPTETTVACVAETLSPVVINGRRNQNGHEKYMSPFDENYSDFIIKNLIKKSGLDEVNYNDIDFYIDPKTVRSKLVKIKNQKIRGYHYNFTLMAQPEILYALYGGLGVKNSQGFGCINIIKST